LPAPQPYVSAALKQPQFIKNSLGLNACTWLRKIIVIYIIACQTLAGLVSLKNKKARKNRFFARFLLSHFKLQSEPALQSENAD
jgi:hypothetical protein